MTHRYPAAPDALAHDNYTPAREALQELEEIVEEIEEAREAGRPTEALIARADELISSVPQEHLKSYHRY